MAVKNDRRQRILTQLYGILSELTIPLLGGPNGPTVIKPGNIVKSRDQLPAELVPGLIMLDADEMPAPPLPIPQGRQTRSGLSLMKMVPEVYVVLDVRQPKNENVSEDLNTARVAILDPVLHDPTLLNIVGALGRIDYGGCVTDLARNRQNKGQMGILIAFTYPFVSDEIAQA